MTRVAVLGWGSLLWDRRTLHVSGQWRADGPSLPIEFARWSGSGKKKDEQYLSLVLYPNATPIRTYWDASLLTDHRDDAICDLRKREGCNLSSIAYLPNAHQQSEIPGVDEEIRKWLNSKKAEIDAVIWTNLMPKLEGHKGKNFAIEDSIQWLDALRTGRHSGTAERYIRMAPSQTDTPLRREVRVRFGWADIPIGF